MKGKGATIREAITALMKNVKTPEKNANIKQNKTIPPPQSSSAPIAHSLSKKNQTNHKHKTNKQTKQKQADNWDYKRKTKQRVLCSMFIALWHM